jgi:signal transduction histidine kinase/ActR/RegA family two-component response regulator
MSGADVPTAKLRRCIRDLAALQALPSMCIGRSPDEALTIVLDAVPTALGSDILHLAVPGSPPIQRAVLRGSVPSEEVAAAIAAAASALEQGGGGPASIDVPGVGAISALTAIFPVAGGHGRLLVGRRTALDVETDVVLARAAANLVGTTLEAARVLEAARRKDEFLAVLGHELRNPLAPITTAVELLARHPEVTREQRIIDRHTRHLARLVDDLLDISRVTRGNIELLREPVPLAGVLERALEIAGPLVSRQRHRLEVDPAPDVTILGDSVRLAQVFGNLLTNAAKFTPPGGRIAVRFERAGDRVRVAVRDDGRGIAADQIHRIFEPFVQADREQDSLRGGLGLGLAIVRSLVERHGGAVTAASEGRGRGSTFTVERPVIAAAVEADPRHADEEAGARRDCRVLVVDDNVDVAELLSEALSYEGFTTAVAHDAPGALELVRDFAPHAAVLDLGLPVVDGYDLARALRAQYRSDLTLIAASGYGQRRDRERAAAAGFACHLVKPVSVRDLVIALDTHLGARADA